VESAPLTAAERKHRHASAGVSFSFRMSAQENFCMIFLKKISEEKIKKVF
jgi:hypothetical protein